MRFIRRTVKILLRLLLALLLLFGISAVLMQFPPVQTWLTQTAANTLSKQLNTDVKVGGVDIDFFKTAVLEDIYIADQQEDTLLYASRLGVDIGLFDLFQSTIFLNKISLENAHLNLYRTQADSVFNYQYLVDYFSPGTTTDSSAGAPWDFGIGKVILENVRFRMLDEGNGRFDFNSNISSWTISANKLDLNEQKIELEKIEIANSKISFRQLKKDSTGNLIQTENTPLAFPGIGWTIVSNKILFENNHLIYSDENVPIIENALDYSHLDLKDLLLSIHDFQYADTGILAEINNGSFKDHGGFILEELKGKIEILPDGIAAKNLLFKTPASHLGNNTTLDFNEFNDLTDFTKKVKLQTAFDHTELAFSDLLMIAPILGEIENLNFPEKDKLIVEGSVALANNKLTADRLKASIGKYVQLNVSGSIAQIITDPLYDLNIRNLSTSYQGLNRFTKGLELPVGLSSFGQFQLSGKLNGTLADLQASELLFKTETTARFAGDLGIQGLPDIDKSIFDLRIKDLATRSDDLKGFSESLLPPELDSLGVIQFSGNFIGTVRKFDIEGGFKTSAGNAVTNLSLDFNEDYSNAKYNGQLAMEDFDLGRVLADTSQIGRITVDVQLNGHGLSINDLNTTLVGQIKKAVFNKYEYQNLYVDGHFSQRLFEGNMKMEDENLTFVLLGSVNLNDSIPDIDATVVIDTINLQKLNLYPENIGISGMVEAKLKGNNLDNLDGKARLLNLAIASEEQSYFDKRITLEAKQLTAGRRALLFNADFLKANINGNYHFGDLPDLVIGYINDFFPVEELALPPDSLLSPRPSKADQQFEFDFQFTDLASLVGVFLPGLEELDTTAFIRGKFDSADKQLELTAQFPLLIYQDSKLDSLNLKLNGNRRRLRSNLAFRNLNLNNTFYAPFIDLNSRLGDDSLRFDLAVEDEDRNTIFKWGGKSTEQLKDYLLVFDQQLILDEEQWDIDAKNQISFNRNALSVNDLGFYKNNQSIVINSLGEAPANDYAPLKLRFINFNLSEVSALLNNPNLQLTGATNGSFTVIEPQQNLHYTADLQVADLTLNEQRLGQFELSASQPAGQQLIVLTASLRGANEMKVDGEYDIAQNQFNIQVDMDKLGLVVADPFMAELMRDSRGYVSGNISISGSPDAPAVNGRINTHDISTHVVLTGTRYRAAENTITITENKVDLGDMVLFDPAERKARVTGGFTHEYFENIQLNIQAVTDGLKVLNTTRKDNPLYYGRLFAKANVLIGGSPEEPTLDVVATTLDSSLLHVEPLIEQLAVVQEDFVIFANPNEYEPDSLKALEQKVGANSIGVDLTLTLIVTPEAQLNVIIDPLTGDELFCQGSGNFTILMNPAGDLNITGTYEIEEGEYAFAYEGLVKRKFEIRKGSSLSFAGDPYNARLDITAVYKTRATTYELISNEVTMDEATLASSQRRTDVEVLLNIDGELTEPVITFDILLPQNQGGITDNLVSRKLNDIKDEPTELNKQVFGLLFFNSFIQSETGAGLSNVGENAALKSVSGLISNQLNRLANRFIKGVDLTLGFESYRAAGTDAGTVSELQVGLSKQLFNNRLSIQVGGNFNLENSQQSALQADGYSSIAGDFVLEYKISERGNYLLKVFHESDYNALLGANTNKTGVGVMYRKSY